MSPSQIVLIHTDFLGDFVKPNPVNLVLCQHAQPVCLCSWPGFRSDPLDVERIRVKGNFVEN